MGLTCNNLIRYMSKLAQLIRQPPFIFRSGQRGAYFTCSKKIAGCVKTYNYYKAATDPKLWQIDA